MKNILSYLGFILALIFSSAPFLSGQTVSASDAEKVAINFMKTQNPQARILAHGTATNAENQQDALIHVFNFQPGGFVLVAGDKKSTPVLGYSDKSNFDLEHLNPEATYFLDEMKAQISALKNEKKLAPMQASWDECLKGKGISGAETEIFVGPYLTTKWGQGLYYNQLCPADNMGSGGHVATGCVATAMAQLIKYHNSPAYGQGSHQYLHFAYGFQSADFENTKYNWSNMPNTLINENMDVATLMYHCGVAVDMNYGPSSSGAYAYKITPALREYFSFSSTMHEIAYPQAPSDFISTLLENLDLAQPVLMAGGGSGGGSPTANYHAWICDGYKFDNYFPFLPVFYSMNWGWDGNSDGYFSMGNFNPGTSSFNFNVGAIFGIEPSCPRNLNLSIPTLAGFPMEVVETITVSAPIIPVIPGLKKINYDAGKCVQMNPGFLAIGSNVTFTAFIQGCGGPAPFSDGENEERSEEEPPTVVKPDDTAVDLDVYPNPFSTTTTITYELPTDQAVDIRIFNATGNLVAQLAQQEQQIAGQYTYSFEANGLPNGVYFLVMQAGDQKMIQRLMLAR
ncbi:MAG: thiol protease/hemagglutinin PrtT [Saprospiraceae bacterium]|nr:thiol protease/hemagglutinin PrtT [Saprospiraceae bacterium]